MIKNMWYAILDSKEVKKNKPIGVVRMGEKLVLWRDNLGKVNCIADKCCHRGAALSCGHVNEGNIVCPFHGIAFDGKGMCKLVPANGKNALVPSNLKTKSYMVKEEYDFIWIFWGDSDKATDKIPFFEELKEGFTYGGIKDHWRNHYSRSIENQLDVVHLPFVHKTTIGRGNATIVNGPKVEETEDSIIVGVFNEKDNGQQPKTRQELAESKQKLFNLQFKYPNVWQNYVNEKIRIVAFFAPIDDENTMLYIRFYQKITNVPIVKNIINSIGAWSSLIIERQDKVVVETQIPKETKLVMGENLIPGDYPIVVYRRKRDEFKEKNNK